MHGGTDPHVPTQLILRRLPWASPIEESTTDCIPIPPPSPHPCCLGPARLQQQQDANHGAVPPEYLAGLRAGRHLSCHLMSPHRRVKQNSPNSLLAVFLIPPTATASLPSRTGGRLTARRNNRPPASDRLPKQRSMTLHCTAAGPGTQVAGSYCACWLRGTATHGRVVRPRHSDPWAPGRQPHWHLAQREIRPNGHATRTASRAHRPNRPRSVAHRAYSFASPPLFLHVSLACPPLTVLHSTSSLSSWLASWLAHRLTDQRSE